MVTTRTVEWTEDGKTFEGLLALPNTGAMGAVLICHAWGGRGKHEEAFAERLAGLGYAAMAHDVYGKGVMGKDNAQCEKLMTPLVEDRELLQRRLRAGLGAFTAQAETSGLKAVVTGFCFGGLCALDLARSRAPVKGAAAFHAILGEPGTRGEEAIEAEVIAFQGFDDPMAGPDDLTAFGREMTRRRARWQLHTFGGVAHAFTDEAANQPTNGLVFDAFARDRSYELFDLFLKRLVS